MSAEVLTKPDSKTAEPPAVLLSPTIDFAADYGLPQQVQRRRWSLSLLAAVMAHVLALLVMIPRTSEFGAGRGTELEGIDIDIVSSASLSRPSSDRPPGTGADNVSYGSAGTGSSSVETEASAAQPDQKRADEQEAAPKEPSQLVLHEDVTKDPHPDDIAAAPKDEPKRQEDGEKTEAKPTAEPADAPSAPTEAAERQETGGAALPGEPSAAPAVVGGAGGAQGAFAQYKMSIVEALAARKPQGRAGLRGTVRVAFTISLTGEVETARVVSSSGRSELDESVLSAVKGIRFPTPPPGMTPGQLHYEIPYYFR